jgi:hypothetical protein
MWRWVITVVLLAGCAGGQAAALAPGPRGVEARRAAAAHSGSRGYPLDRLRRSYGAGAASCPKLELRRFGGDSLRFLPAARVVEPFRKRLLALERVVREVSLRVYERTPAAILVAASYGCRSVRGQQRRLSEHAMGNAIDIAGFRFAPLEGKAAGKVPRALAAGFDVRVDQHWKGRGNAIRRRHARFLKELTSALLARDVFRTLLGPGHRDHSDHFHFDMAPQHYVDL